MVCNEIPLQIGISTGGCKKMNKAFRFIILIQIMIFMAFSICSKAAEIQNIRYYSEKDQTRIVIQLDSDAKYKMQYDKKHNLSIILLKSTAGNISKLYKVDDALINSIELKEINDGLLNVFVDLKKPAAFNMFPLESPSRIVIDATTYENVIEPEIVSVSDQYSMVSLKSETDVAKPEIVKTSNSSEITDEDLPLQENSTASENHKVKRSWLSGFDYSLISAFFDILFLIFIIYMNFKIGYLAKFANLIKKNRLLLKGNQFFTNIMNELEHKE